MGCRLLLAAAFAWVAIAPTSARPYTELRPLYWGIPGIAIVWAVLSTEGRIAYHKWKPALAVGDASYALYLVHPIVLAVMWAVFKKLGLADVRWLVFPLMIAGSLVAGLITHWVVERPITRSCAAGWIAAPPQSPPPHPDAGLPGPGDGGRLLAVQPLHHAGNRALQQSGAIGGAIIVAAGGDVGEQGERFERRRGNARRALRSGALHHHRQFVQVEQEIRPHRLRLAGRDRTPHFGDAQNLSCA